MWLDELFSWNLITDTSIRHMLAALGDQADGSPPLYYLLARGWSALVPASELSFRMFSSVGFCIGVAFVWFLLRRVYEFWPSVLALSSGLAANATLRFENGNARFYGLLFALVAIAALLTTELSCNRSPRWPLLIANSFVHAALVLCHPFGVIYGGALFVALIAFDLAKKTKPRLPVSLSYLAGWATLFTWWRQFARQAEINQPHGWIPVPTMDDLLRLFGEQTAYGLFFLFLVLAVVIHLKLRNTVTKLHHNDSADDSTRRGRGITIQTTIALTLISLSPIFWIISQLVPPSAIFFPRYLLIGTIGWIIIAAEVFSRLLQNPFWPTPFGKLVGGALALAAICPFALDSPPQRPALTGILDTIQQDGDLPVVCPRSHDYLPRSHYSPARDRYYFLLDWTAATAADADPAATGEYKIMAALQRNFDRFEHIVPADEFLARHRRFLFLNNAPPGWRSAILPESRYTFTEWPTRGPAMLLAERKSEYF